jgi:5-methylcytosine-specific restriction endonuclease McrA
MGKHQRDWAKKETNRLRELLGGRCACCGSDKDLEFDVILPDGSDHHRKYEWSWRLSFYRFHYKANNLQLLCSKCNSRKGDDVIDYRGTFREQGKFKLDEEE